MIADSIHTIDEENVGIYLVRGALDDEISLPATRSSQSFVTEVKQITIRPVTSTLTSITTVTKDGIAITFDDLQVISSVSLGKLIPVIKKFGIKFREALVFNRIKEELRIL